MHEGHHETDNVEEVIIIKLPKNEVFEILPNVGANCLAIDQPRRFHRQNEAHLGADLRCG
jgi:hypothetical protein